MFAPRFHGALSCALHFLLVSCGLAVVFRAVTDIVLILLAVLFYSAAWWLALQGFIGGFWHVSGLFTIVLCMVPVGVYRAFR